MKSNFFLILFCLFFIQVSVGQEISKSDIVKFKIKSITTIDGDGKIKYTEFYNDKGNFFKQGSLNENDQFQLDRELFYDDSAQLIEERTYTPDGKINTTTKYYYNEKNLLSKSEHISFGEVSATWTYEYDDRGNKVTETQTSGLIGNSLTKYKYSDKNYLIQEDKSNNSIGKEERIKYEYNERGQIVQKKTKAFYFNTTITLTYFYNDLNRLTKLIEKSSNGVSSTTVYEYDDKGLLIGDKWESSISKTPQKTTYQINYE